MRMKQFALGCGAVFAIVLLVNLVVISLFGLEFHGSVELNWEIALTITVSFGLVLPWMRRRERKKNGRNPPSGGTNDHEREQRDSKSQTQ